MAGAGWGGAGGGSWQGAENLPPGDSRDAKRRAESLACGITQHVVPAPHPCTPISLSDSLHSGSFCAPVQVLNESDLDNDNMLSFSEFEHAMAKSPDFMK